MFNRLLFPDEFCSDTGGVLAILDFALIQVVLMGVLKWSRMASSPLVLLVRLLCFLGVFFVVGVCLVDSSLTNSVPKRRYMCEARCAPNSALYHIVPVGSHTLVCLRVLVQWLSVLDLW